MFITNSPAPSRINSAELPQRDVTVWEFAIFGYFPCIIRTVRTRSFNHKHKHRKMAIFCYFFSCFFLFLELGIFLFKLEKNNLFGIGNTTEYRSSKRAKKNPVISTLVVSTTLCMLSKFNVTGRHKIFRSQIIWRMLWVRQPILPQNALRHDCNRK